MKYSIIPVVHSTIPFRNSIPLNVDSPKKQPLGISHSVLQVHADMNSSIGQWCLRSAPFHIEDEDNPDSENRAHTP